MFKWMERLIRGKPVYRVDFIATGFMGNKYIAHSVNVPAKNEVGAACYALRDKHIANKLYKINWKYRAKLIGYEKDMLITDYLFYISEMEGD